uniref:Cytochrome P450 n=1 Tax=Leersia perrieri TaxID=77586 RepID=A0A0D9XR05_9ORYZ
MQIFSSVMNHPYTAISTCCVAFVIGWLVHWVYRWMNPRCNGRLPPGSMSFPLVGETLRFFRASASIDMPCYYKERLKRYGPIFKTNLVGQPLVVSLDPDMNRFIFQQEGKLFQSWYPETTNAIFGKKSITTNSGAVHKFVRSFASKLFGTTNLKESLLPELETTMRENLITWAREPSIEVKDGISNMIFDLIAKKLIGLEPSKSRELRKSFQEFFQGMVSFPIYFPGTPFYRCMQGRTNLQKTLNGLLKERLSVPEIKYNDLLDQIVEELQSENLVIDVNFAVDALSALLFASFATLSSTLAVGFKFLTDNPKVVKELKEEHTKILNKRDDQNSGFTWEEYKSLIFTPQVINEITQIGNVAPGIFRKTLADVQVNGYTIPAGWLVMISPMAVHLNPKLFEAPLEFNPWRWKAAILKVTSNLLTYNNGAKWQVQDETKRSELLRNYMPFGGGIRLCLGADFSKLFFALFFHILVTEYRRSKEEMSWRISEIIFPQGYHIQLIPQT